MSSALGWGACEPERRADRSHTGSVIVRERVAEALAALAEQHGVTDTAIKRIRSSEIRQAQRFAREGI